MFKWELGRQSSGYAKFKIFSFYKYDMYILKFPEGSVITPHVDIVDSRRHFRANIIIKHAKTGGTFKCLNTICNFSRLKIFRPDMEMHSVSKIIKGTRYVLSIGWVFKNV
jgi:hypothetical protein